jgi:predicted Zn-dependent peptidase
MTRNISLKILALILIPLSLYSQERFRRSPPYPDPLPRLELPQIETHALSNDLRLFVVHRDALPVITLRLIIRSGESSSPANLPGLATFTANMLMRGTSKYSASDIEEIVDVIGGEFTSETFPDYTVFSFSFLEEYLDQALELLGEMILNPSFSRGEIVNLQRSMFYDMARKRVDPEISGRRLLLQLLFADHPYQKYAFSDDIIKDYSQKDVRALFQRCYLPNNAFLVAVGNLNLETAARKVSHYLNTWKEAPLSRERLPAPEPTKDLRICFLRNEQMRDVSIYMGTFLPDKTSRDYFPLIVLNQVLGGTSLSRLFMNLRESKRYAYWAYSRMEFFDACGVFYVRTRVKPDVIYASIQEAFKEINNATGLRLPARELEQAKSVLIGNFPLRLETYDDLSSRISEIKALNLGDQHWNQYYDNIMFIDSQVVYESSRRHSLQPSIIVIVGNSDVLKYHMREFDVVEVYDIQGEFQYLITGERE